ncbi:MAG: glycosyltransferase family 4 protein, partial [Candidatus Kapaibacterium sp.]
QATLADASATITERDKITLQNYVPNAVVNTVTASIDLNDFPYSSIENRKQNTLLMIGSDMNWAPNKDSVVWFVNKILPLILKDSPDTIFYLVGDNPPLDELPLPNKNFVMLGKNSNIKELYSTISVGIVPLRLGGGMRIKILEMMSAGMPFVSTSIGAEGNFAAPNEHYLLGNTEIEFAKSTIQLLKSKELQNILSINSNEFVHKNYSDKSTIKVFEELLTNAVLNFNKNVKN